MLRRNRQSGVGIRLFSHLLLVWMVAWIAGCGAEEITSHWRYRPIAIDGKYTDWQGLLQPFGEKGTSLAVTNDSSFVYLVLVTNNHDVQRLVRMRGLTLWFDNKGGQEKRFGIHYPLGYGGFRPPSDEHPPEGVEVPVPAQSIGASDELEILTGGEGERSRMTMAQASGIEIHFALERDTLVYEMKVPLFDNGRTPFAIGTQPGATIGAGVVSQFERGGGGKLPAEGRGGGGEHGAGTGRHGGGGRQGGEYGRSQPNESGGSQSIDEWATVQLSSSPGSKTPK